VDIVVGLLDMRDLGPVHEHEPVPIRQAIKFSSVAGSLARRRQASAR